MLWAHLFSCWPQSSTSSLMLRLWTTSTSGQRLDRSTIFSSRRCSDFQTSGRISLKRLASTLSLLQEIQQLSSQPGNTFLEVPGHHKNSLIVTLTSHWFAEYWLSVQPLSWQSHLRMPEELTMLIRPGHWSWEGTIPQRLKLYLEFHSRRDQPIYSREDSHWLSINSSSGPPTSTSTFLWRTSSSCSGSTMILVTTSLRPYSWVCLSDLHLLLLIQPTWLEKWLTCGQRREEASAPGTIAIDNASSGWLRTWNSTTTTTWEVCSLGRRGTDSSTSLDSGWPIVLVWCPTVTRPTTHSSPNSLFSQSLYELQQII